VYNRSTVSLLGAVDRIDWKIWRQPPQPLLVILYSFTALCISLLGWLGWRLIDQERLVESQRAQERIEQEADRVVATLRSMLVDRAERLDAWDASSRPPDGALVVMVKGGSIETFGGNLLFSPLPPALPEANPQLFLKGEELEFALSKPAEAVAIYQPLAISDSAPVRAGALVRIARIYRRMGATRLADDAYRKLAAIPNALVAGAPADLVARTELKDPTVGRDLLHGRWQVTRDQLEFYWSKASHEALPADAMALSEAAAMAVEIGKRNQASRGEETLRVGDRSFFLLWRGGPERRLAMISSPESLVPRTSKGVAVALCDEGGRTVAGSRETHHPAAVRMSAESQIPWTIYVTASNGSSPPGFADQKRFLTCGISLMIAFLLLGAHFIAKAIRREAQTARMQSEFVSSVSHEFRSPLTSMRQLSELLSTGRVPSEGRRQIYYETLVSETTRLQRLIESLLNFGRMEAGARQYVFEVLDVANVIAQVTGEFGVSLADSGRRIETIAPAASCLIEADPDAIAVALRNLLDNALKYSPQNAPVSVEWKAREDFIAIEVRDSGCGIPPSERRIIFRKFVRGSAARSVNVKGSGVGLAMARHIVSAHGGAITLESEPGRGSAFTMLLRSAERA
jgi:K+-sensing histidine kinase KdpD